MVSSWAKFWRNGPFAGRNNTFGSLDSSSDRRRNTVNNIKILGPPTAICLAFILLSFTSTVAHAATQSMAGAVGAPAQWQLIESWAGTVSAPVQWNLVDSWSGTVSAPAQWSLVGSWTGTVSAPAQWQLIESWTNASSAQAGWSWADFWSGSISVLNPPIADFISFLENPMLWNEFTFKDNLRARRGHIENIRWDFNSDGEWDRYGKTVTYRFESGPDNYRVRLEVVDNFGQSSLIEKIVEVSRDLKGPEMKGPAPEDRLPGLLAQISLIVSIIALAIATYLNVRPSAQRKKEF